MEIFASSKSMLQVKMLEVIQNRFSGLLPYRHRIKLNLFSGVTYRILCCVFQPVLSAVQGTDR